jgi:Pyruvate/2-oxoacid:ferredoxin oxidoreductase delta subunit
MKYKWLPVFDINNCTGCRACTSYCVSGSLTIVDEIVSFKDPEACLSDEFCVRECPSGGIHMEWLPVPNNTHLGKIVNNKPAMQKLA